MGFIHSADNETSADKSPLPLTDPPRCSE